MHPRSPTAAGGGDAAVGAPTPASALAAALINDHASHRRKWRDVLDLVRANPALCEQWDHGTGCLPAHLVGAHGGRQEVAEAIVACYPAAHRLGTRGQRGSTPLHLACALGNVECAEVFASADPQCVHLRDAEGMRPVERAIETAGRFPDEPSFTAVIALSHATEAKHPPTDGAGVDSAEQSSGASAARAPTQGGPRAMEEFVEDLLRARGLAPDYVCAASASEVDAEDAWWAAEDAEVDTWTESDVAEMAAQRARVARRDGCAAGEHNPVRSVRIGGHAPEQALQTYH